MFYAVVKGRKPGIYNSWSECENQVSGFRGSQFQKFKTKEAAENCMLNSSGRPTKVTKQSKISNFFKVIPSSNPKITISSKISKVSHTKGAFIPDYYVYTDGACSHNGRKNAKAGIGIYFADNDIRNKFERVIGRQTNNTAELTAIIKTYNLIKTDLDLGKKVCIASDSQYSIRCATAYGKKMAKNNWKKDIPNKGLVKKIYELYGNNRNIMFKHVRAHTGNTDIHSIGNDHADRLANKAIGLTNCPYQ
uniref:Ribonuclease H n=1 Tax=viral metagenome TaxID=1070528 RepID=A0A6C0B3V2_9ZZZZ